MKRKLIWIIDHYSSEPIYGGISRQYDFARELDKRGYNVIIFSSGFSHYTHSYISERELFISKPFTHVRYVYIRTIPYQENSGINRAKNMISFMIQVLRYEKIVAKNYGKPDVVEGASVHPLAWVAAYVIAQKYDIKFVAEIRDFWPQIWIDSGEKNKMNPMCLFFKIIENFTFKHADKIIYSLYHGDKYICGKRGVSKEKVFLIGQPMDCERYDRNRKRFEYLPDEIKEFLSDGFICGFAGYYMEYDGVNIMLEAEKILQERKIPVKMLFVGSGEAKQGMLRYVEENGLENVLIADRLPKEDVPALLSHCHACMAHIEYRGKESAFQYGVSKNKVNDYLYSGACTLFGFRYDDNEVTESGGGIQFRPYDSYDLADKIEYLFHLSVEEQNEFGKRGRTYIRNNHGVEVLTNKLLEALF